MGNNKNSKKFCIISVLALVSIIVFLVQKSPKKESFIVILKPTALLSEPERPEGSNTIDILAPYTVGKIIGIAYSKEYMFYQIIHEEGRKGFILFDLDCIREIDIYSEKNTKSEDGAQKRKNN